jgi:hypothetical protein
MSDSDVRGDIDGYAIRSRRCWVTAAAAHYIPATTRGTSHPLSLRVIGANIDLHPASHPKVLDSRQFKRLMVHFVFPSQTKKTELAEWRHLQLRNVEERRNSVSLAND